MIKIQSNFMYLKEQTFTWDWMVCQFLDSRVIRNPRYTLLFHQKVNIKIKLKTTIKKKIRISSKNPYRKQIKYRKIVKES